MGRFSHKASKGQSWDLNPRALGPSAGSQSLHCTAPVNFPNTYYHAHFTEEETEASEEQPLTEFTRGLSDTGAGVFLKKPQSPCTRQGGWGGIRQD